MPTRNDWETLLAQPTRNDWGALLRNDPEAVANSSTGKAGIVAGAGTIRTADAAAPWEDDPVVDMNDEHARRWWESAPLAERKRPRWTDAPMVDQSRKSPATPSGGESAAPPAADDREQLPPWLVADPSAPGGVRGWTNAERLAASNEENDRRLAAGEFTADEHAAEATRLDAERGEVAALETELGREATPFDVSLRRSVAARGAVRRSWPVRTAERTVNQMSSALGGMAFTAGAELGSDAAKDIRDTGRDFFLRAAAEQQHMDEQGAPPAAIASKAIAMIGEILGIGAVHPGAVLPYIVGNSVQEQLAQADQDGRTGLAKYGPATAHGAIDAAAYFVGGRWLGAGLQKLAGAKVTNSTAVDLATNYVAKRYSLGPAMRRLAQAGGEGGAQAVLGIGQSTAHYLVDVGAGEREFDAKELATQLLAELPTNAATGALAGGVHDLVRTLDRRRRELPQAAAGVEAAQQLIDAANGKPPIERVAGVPGVHVARRFFENATPEQLESVRRPMSQSEFARVTGIKKSTETFREAFRETLNYYAQAKKPQSSPSADARSVLTSDGQRQNEDESGGAIVPPAGTRDNAAPTEGVPAVPPLTSARAEAIAADRAALDLPELPDAERRSWHSALAAADESGIPADALKLAQEVGESPRPLSDVETAGLAIKAAELKNQHRAATQTLHDAPAGAAARYQAAELDRLQAEFDTVSRALRLSGTEKGRALAAQKLTINQDFDLVSVVARAKAAGATKPNSELARNFRPEVKELETIDARITNHKGTAAELDELLFQQFKLRRGIREKIAAHKPKTLGGRLMELFDISRALRASSDLSAVLRQGKFFATGRPVMTAKALPDMFAALRSERGAFLANKRIHERPNAPLYEDSGLFLHRDEGPLSAREEVYASSFVEKLPIVAGTQRAYTMFLNRLRADAFDTLTETLGRNGEVTRDQARTIANLVNVATGRGDAGAAEAAMRGLSVMFFAPRYTLSRFQLLAGQPLWRGDAQTRKLVAKEYARSLVGMGTLYGLAAAAWGDRDDFSITFDPRSSDFGKIKLGNTRLDPLGGLAQTARILAHIVTGERVNKYGRVVPMRGPHAERGTDVANTVWRFARTKMAPLPESALNLMAGEDITGEPINLNTREGAGNLAKGMFVPLSWRDIQAAMEEQGAARGTALSLLALFGDGLQTYDAVHADTPEQFFQLQSQDLLGAIRQAEREISRAYREPDAAGAGDLGEAYDTYENRRRELVEDWRGLVEGARQRGIDERTIRGAIIDAGGRSFVAPIFGGRYQPYLPSDKTIDEIISVGGRARWLKLHGKYREHQARPSAAGGAP